MRTALIALGLLVALAGHVAAMFTMGWVTVVWLLFVAVFEIGVLVIAYVVYFVRSRRIARLTRTHVFVGLNWLALVAPLVRRPIVSDQKESTGVHTWFDFTEALESSSVYGQAMWIVVVSVAAVFVTSIAIGVSLRDPGHPVSGTSWTHGRGR